MIKKILQAIYDAQLKRLTEKHRVENVREGLVNRAVEMAEAEAQEDLEWLAGIIHGWHVTLFLHDQAYGGGEEGGWWYDTDLRINSPLNRSFLFRKWAYEYQKSLEGEMERKNEGRLPTSSVLSDGIYVMIVTVGAPAEFYPEVRPHYE